jgi:hypothetical protein
MVEEVEHRFKKHDEKDIHISEFEKHQEAFLNFVKEAEDKGIKIHVIDTYIFFLFDKLLPSILTII